MGGNLVMVVGAYRLVRQLGEGYAASLPGIRYYRSIEEDLRGRQGERAGETEIQLYETIFKNERDRDTQILADFGKDTECILVEQWHVGNLARASIRAPLTGVRYRKALAEALREFAGFRMYAFYVSTDLVKWVSSEDVGAKGKELNILTSVLRETGVQVETIDGDALPSNLQQRLAYLLGCVLGTQEA